MSVLPSIADYRGHTTRNDGSTDSCDPPSVQPASARPPGPGDLPVFMDRDDGNRFPAKVGRVPADLAKHHVLVTQPDGHVGHVDELLLVLEENGKNLLGLHGGNTRLHVFETLPP